MPATDFDRAGRAAMTVLLLVGGAVIFLPLILTLYLSVLDEQMIVFPPRGYTLAWYGQIMGKFGAAIWTSLRIAAAAVVPRVAHIAG